jgi:predicted PurR-regulated permease PerM
MFTIIVVGALLFVYLIFPVVSRLNRRLPLGAAIAIIYVAIAALVALGVYIVAPILSRNVQQLIHDAPSLVHSAQLVLTNPNNPFTQHLPAGLRDYLTRLPSEVERNIASYGTKVAGTVLPVLVSIVSFSALFIIIPVVAAYMLLESGDIKQTFMGFVPERARPKTLQIITDLDQVVGGFIRGQLIVAVIVGLLVTLLLSGLHVRYALLIGVIAGVLDVIPYIGAVAGWLPAFFIALFTNGPRDALFVTLGIIAINQLEGHIIAPNVVSKSVGLSPLAVVLALLAGGEIAGIPGLLLAVPVAGMVRVLIVDLVPRTSSVKAQPALEKAHAKRPLFSRLFGK